MARHAGSDEGGGRKKSKLERRFDKDMLADEMATFLAK